MIDHEYEYDAKTKPDAGIGNAFKQLRHILDELGKNTATLLEGIAPVLRRASPEEALTDAGPPETSSLAEELISLARQAQTTNGRLADAITRLDL